MYKICDLCSTYFLANEGYEVHKDYGIMCWLCWDEEEEKEKDSKEYEHDDRKERVVEEDPRPNPVFSVISSSFIVNDDKK